jgi:hypothetical protein
LAEDIAYAKEVETQKDLAIAAKLKAKKDHFVSQKSKKISKKKFGL